MNRKSTVSPSFAPLRHPSCAPCVSSCHPAEELDGLHGAARGLPLLSLGPQHPFKVHRKGSRALSTYRDTQSRPGGGRSCNIGLVCKLSTQHDKNICLKRKLSTEQSWKPVFLTTLTSIFLGRLALSHYLLVSVEKSHQCSVESGEWERSHDPQAASCRQKGPKPGRLLLAAPISNWEAFSSRWERLKTESKKKRCASLPVWWLQVPVTYLFACQILWVGSTTEPQKAELDGERPSSGRAARGHELMKGLSAQVFL